MIFIFSIQLAHQQKSNTTSHLGLHCTFTCFNFYLPRIRNGWSRFRALLYLLTKIGVALVVKGKLYSTCKRGVILYKSKTSLVKDLDVIRLARNNPTMTRCICNTRPDNKISVDLTDCNRIWGENIYWMNDYNSLVI